MCPHGPTINRDLTKTLSFAAIHFSVAFAIGYALTGSWPIATGLALLEPLANTVAFFVHERAWRAWEAAHNQPERAVA